MRYLIFLFIAFNSFSQDSNYDWEKNPQPFKDTVIQNEDAVVLKKYNDVTILGEEPSSLCKIISHIKTLVLTETGIEKTNKFYYYIDRAKKLIELKARVITPSGKIINVPQERIIESIDEKNRTQYKYFAFEGVEKGSVLEVFIIETYTLNISFSLIEDFFTANSEFKIMDFETRFTRDQSFLINYEITINKHLYNVTTIQEDRIFQTKIKAKNLPKYIDEPYSYSTDYEAYIYYQLGYAQHLKFANLEGFKGKRFQFSALTEQQIIEKRLWALLTDEIDTSGMSKIEILYAIENFIKADGKTVEKNNITVMRLGQPTFTEEQQTKLIFQYATLFNLNPTIILSTDINRFKITNELEAPFLYTDLFILFPETQEVYSPSKYTRIHAIPQHFLGNHYLNTLSYAHYEFKASAPEFSIDSVAIHLTPNFNELSDSISLYRETSGHFCRNFMSEDEAMSPQAKASAFSYFIHYHLPETEIYDSILENDNFINYMKKPLIGKFKAISTSDLTQVDSTYLLSIGRYLGNQISLHNENPFKRISPIRVGNPHIYKRKIIIQIPENYQIQNLSDLMITTSDAAKELGLGFQSTYSIDGNILTISIQEWYNKPTYQAQFYRLFLEVMNTSADFNNVQLAFERK